MIIYTTQDFYKFIDMTTKVCFKLLFINSTSIRSLLMNDDQHFFLRLKGIVYLRWLSIPFANRLIDGQTQPMLAQCNGQN